jgi:DNA-binding NarL/FixJ family response regulator
MNKNTSGAQPEGRVLLVDAGKVFARRLEQLLDRPGGFRLLELGPDRDAVSEAVARLNPDLVMMVFDPAVPESLVPLCQLATGTPGSRVLGVARRCGAPEAERLLTSGVQGVLLATEPDDQILKAIETVAGGELFVSRTVLMPLLRRMLDAPPSIMPSGVDCLTDRELSVFELLGCGLRPREIAAQLGVSTKTVDSHIEKIRHRLGLDGASALLQQACLWVQQNLESGASPAGIESPDLPTSSDDGPAGKSG